MNGLGKRKLLFGILVIAFISISLTIFVSFCHNKHDVVEVDYSGLEYPPFPPDMALSTGVYLSQKYELIFVDVNENSNRIGLFSRRQVSTDNGWIVLDSFYVPDYTEDDVLVLDGCYIDGYQQGSGTYDRYIVAIGTLDEEAKIFRFLDSEDLHYAWKLNKVDETIESISVEGLECPTGTMIFLSDY